MRFRLVRTGKNYTEPEEVFTIGEADVNTRNNKSSVPPIIWETGNAGQIRSLLLLREAEVVVAQTHLTGDPYRDWYVNNSVRDLEIKIANLRR